jgi:hypothetical protein
LTGRIRLGRSGYTEKLKSRIIGVDKLDESATHKESVVALRHSGLSPATLIADQKITFSDPWNTLAPILVAEICPKLPEEGLLALGLLKDGWFKRLKASMRNASENFSLIGKMRDI